MQIQNNCMGFAIVASAEAIVTHRSLSTDNRVTTGYYFVINKKLVEKAKVSLQAEKTPFGRILFLIQS